MTHSCYASVCTDSRLLSSPSLQGHCNIYIHAMPVCALTAGCCHHLASKDTVTYISIHAMPVCALTAGCCLPQVHETEVIVKLASALNMTHSELENELRKSVLGETSIKPFRASCLQSVVKQSCNAVNYSQNKVAVLTKRPTQW